MLQWSLDASKSFGYRVVTTETSCFRIWIAFNVNNDGCGFWMTRLAHLRACILNKKVNFIIVLLNEVEWSHRPVFASFRTNSSEKTCVGSTLNPINGNAEKHEKIWIY